MSDLKFAKIKTKVYLYAFRITFFFLFEILFYNILLYFFAEKLINIKNKHGLNNSGIFFCVTIILCTWFTTWHPCQSDLPVVARFFSMTESCTPATCDKHSSKINSLP
jgi:hypothetical protein